MSSIWSYICRGLGVPHVEYIHTRKREKEARIEHEMNMNLYMQYYQNPGSCTEDSRGRERREEEKKEI
jgi:hypothetical protein